MVNISEIKTDYDRRVASEGWVRISLLETKMLDEQESTSPLAKLSKANMLYHTYEDPELQGEGLPIIISMYVQKTDEEQARRIIR